MSTMPKVVCDALNFGDLFDYPFYHSHADGSTYNIMRRVNDIQVTIENKTITTDFLILESKAQGNKVLGRTFLKSVGGFINVKYGFIHFNSPINCWFFFPLKNREVLVEANNDIDFENT